jgi:hypothetical protein
MKPANGVYCDPSTGRVDSMYVHTSLSGLCRALLHLLHNLLRSVWLELQGVLAPTHIVACPCF